MVEVCAKQNKPGLCSVAIKHLALRPDYYSQSKLLSALWNTVSSQSEAYFGAGTKLTVLGKMITKTNTKINVP